MAADLPDEEIDDICKPYTQNAAKVRYLRSLGLNVRQKPNGRPLVNRKHYDAVMGGNRETVSAGTMEPTWLTA